MKRPWTRGEKWLWATPILVGLFAAGMTFGPNTVRRGLGWPQTLMTTPDTTIRSMALSQNGEVVAAAGPRSDEGKSGWKRGSGTVYLWNARTAEPLASIPPVYTRDEQGYLGGWDIHGLALSPDAKQIGFSRLSSTPQGHWTLYDVATQKPLWRFPQFISNAEFSRDGRYVALPSNSHISIVNAHDGQMRTQWKLSGTPNSPDVSWSPDGNWVACVGPSDADDPIEWYRADNGKLVRRIQSPQFGSDKKVASVAFSPDSKRLVIASSVSGLRLDENFDMFAPVRCYDTGTGELLWEVKSSDLGGADRNHSFFCDAAFSPDGRVIAAYQYFNERIFLLDSATGAIKTTLRFGRASSSKSSSPPGLAFSPDSKRLFARGERAVLFWDLE